MLRSSVGQKLCLVWKMYFVIDVLHNRSQYFFILTAFCCCFFQRVNDKSTVKYEWVLIAQHRNQSEWTFQSQTLTIETNQSVFMLHRVNRTARPMKHFV